MQCVLTAARSSRRPIRQAIIRHHMSHGSPDALAAPPIQTGPREALQLGFDSAKASQNILRLLESSHGTGSLFGDTLSTVWHPTGKRWTYSSSTGWVCSSYNDDQEDQLAVTTKSSSSTPRLEWLNFSDNRTALAKLQGVDGSNRYVSMLRLDPDAKRRHVVHANDGWCIVREVQSDKINTMEKQGSSLIRSIPAILEEYLSIEHGGGCDDRDKARGLFAPDASLISVGTSPLEDEPTDWSSPSGSLLNISLDTYLHGVEHQTTHSDEAKAHDLIVQLDTLPTAAAAAATVHVGNGAQTTLFVDHLLLGHHNERWQILSKTFSSRPYPK